MTEISTSPTALTASLNLSGVNVVTNVSGQVVSISGNPVGNLIYDSSGDTWRPWYSSSVSGSARPAIVIGSSTSLTAAAILNNASSDTRSTTTVGLDVEALNLAYEPVASVWTRIRVTASGQGISGVTNKLIVTFSGDSVREMGTSILAAPATTATGASGGVELGSGVVFNVNVRAMSVNSGVLYVGGTGTNAPFSGQGQVLAATDPALTFKVDNLNRIRVFATASGDRVTFAGTV